MVPIGPGTDRTGASEGRRKAGLEGEAVFCRLAACRSTQPTFRSGGNQRSRGIRSFHPGTPPANPGGSLEMGREPQHAVTSSSPANPGGSLARGTRVPAPRDAGAFRPATGTGPAAPPYCALIELMVTVFLSSLRTPVTMTSVPANSMTFC